MLVRIDTNYSFPAIEKQLPDGKKHWNDIYFTTEKVRDCDFLIVINKPTEEIICNCRKGGKWLIVQEPPYRLSGIDFSYFKYFDRVYCQFPKQINKNIINSQTCLPWHVSHSFDELISMKLNYELKHDNLSWITSNKEKYPGHNKRLEFMKLLMETNLHFDLYGRGFNYLKKKEDGLNSYKYTLAIENYNGAHYWTEKISDAFLCYTMPIYYGCTNISDYFPEKSFIQIDIQNLNQSYETIQKAIINNSWQKNLDFIIQSRNLILYKYQLYPFIYHEINRLPGFQKDASLHKNIIPLNPGKDSLFTRLRRRTIRLK
ncbi:MAG: glycosyltransferase family 10 [Cytophagales bacterium]|nr:glycosyltransferase family 10 [Cytophagales bacterium]